MKQIEFDTRYSSKGAFKKAGGKIIKAQSLFGADWTLKDKGLCPHCGRKLYAMRNGKFLCKSKSHLGQKVFNS